MLKIKNLQKTFNQQSIIKNINLEIEQGSVVALIGSSGAGKSTLLHCLNLLEKPDRGELTLNGQHYNLANLKQKALLQLRQQMMMVFQHFNLFQHRTALENIMEGPLIVQHKSKKIAQQIALQQLEKVGLLDKCHHYPKQLSGGQQQRVGIARALAMQPKVLLLDEPTSALDPELVNEVQAVIKNAASEGHTMLLVSHEMKFILQVADRILFLEQGEIVEDNNLQHPLNAEQLGARTRAFLGMDINHWNYEI